MHTKPYDGNDWAADGGLVLRLERSDVEEVGRPKMPVARGDAGLDARSVDGQLDLGPGRTAARPLACGSGSPASEVSEP